MNIVSKCALVGASVIVAYACAKPVDIEDDVLIANPSDFPDSGILPAAGGTGGDIAQGGTGAGTNGTAGTTGGTATASLGGTSSGLGGTSSGLGGTSSGSAGQPSAAGSGGTPAGSAGTAGASSAGTGGTGGAPGSAGTGGTAAEPVFDASSCDFVDLTGCEDLTCEEVCPTNDGGSCLTRCNSVIECVTTNATCIAEDDPLCGGRDSGVPRECTTVVEPAGGFDQTNPSQPSFVARQFVECVCSVPRP